MCVSCCNDHSCLSVSVAGWQEIIDKVKAAEVIEKSNNVNKKTIDAAKSRLSGFLKFDADDESLYTV